MMRRTEEVQDFDGGSTSCVFEEQRGSLEINALIAGQELKRKKDGDEGGQRQAAFVDSE